MRNPAHSRFPSRCRSSRGSTELVAIFILTALLLIMSSALSLAIAIQRLVADFDAVKQWQVAADSLADMTTEAIYNQSQVAPAASGAHIYHTLTDAISSKLVLADLADDGGAVSFETTAPIAPRITQPIAAFGSSDLFPDSAIAAGGFSARLAALIEGRPAEELTPIVTTYQMPGYSVVVTSRLFSVPITSIDVVAYPRPGLANGGLSATGALPVPTWTRPSNLRSLVCVPYSASDPSTRTDIFSRNGGGLPYIYRPDVVLSWDLYQFLFSFEFRSALIQRGTALGAIDLSSPTLSPSDGISLDADGQTVIIDLELFPDTRNILLLNDAVGGRRIRLQGTASEGLSPLQIFVNNSNSYSPTRIELSGDNNRTVLLFPGNAEIVSLSPPRAWRAGIIADHTTSFTGQLNLYGHLSLPQTTATWPTVQVFPDSDARSDLARVSPRALVVSSRGVPTPN